MGFTLGNIDSMVNEAYRWTMGLDRKNQMTAGLFVEHPAAVAAFGAVGLLAAAVDLGMAGPAQDLLGRVDLP